MARAKPLHVLRLGFAGGLSAAVVAPEREHAHAEIELNFLLGGGVRYLYAGQEVDLPAGRWLAYWAALPHRVIAADPGCDLAWFTVPIATFTAWDDAGLAARLLAGEIVVEPRMRAGAEAEVRDCLGLLAGDARRKRIAALELEAVALRLAIDGKTLVPALAKRRGRGGGSRARQPSGTAGPAAVETMCAWLADHYREDVAIAACARAAGLHPTYAMTIFRRACGVTIWQYLTRLRLAHAQRLLLTTGRDVLDIALDAGFGSQARFYVAFRRAFSTTPAALRRAKGPVARDGGTPARQDPDR
jgi:AraC-like DNA-binding protein